MRVKRQNGVDASTHTAVSFVFVETFDNSLLAHYDNPLRLGGLQM